MIETLHQQNSRRFSATSLCHC